MFVYYKFNQDISRWNVSNVDNMLCVLNLIRIFLIGDMSSVTEMNYMFSNAEFNQDISDWNLSRVYDMSFIFSWHEFKSDTSRWDFSYVLN